MHVTWVGQVLSPLPVRVLPYDQCYLVTLEGFLASISKRSTAAGERPMGSRIVHFVRHGQAEHNVALAKGGSGPQHVDSRPGKTLLTSPALPAA